MEENEAWYIIDRCGWNGTSPGTSISRTLGRWSAVTLPLISQRFVSILYSKAFDNPVDGFADNLQKPDILVYKKIQDVFVKLSDQNNHNSIC